MKRIFLSILITMAILSMLLAQTTIRDQIFTETDGLLNKAKKELAHVYAPKNFSKAMDDYSNAESVLKKGGNLEDIRRRLKSANVYFKKAIKFADVARVSFGSAIASRNDALSAEANIYAAKLWKEAEGEFKDAMEEMEADDLEDAKKTSGKAESIYRKAELDAIKGNLLNPAKDLLQKAKRQDADDYAPTTFKKVKQFIFECEKELKENRYDRDNARELAQMAKYEAQHAIYLTGLVKELRKKDNIIEELILMGEKPLADIADRLQTKVSFEEGYGNAVAVINMELDSLLNSNEDYQGLILNQNERVASLSDQISLMEQRLGKFTESEEELRHKIELKNQQEQKVKIIAQTITRDEGKVLRDGDNVVIRLYGLNFPSGKSTIRPENFGLLKKVQDGIRNFENSNIIIEGHTDSRGSDAVNQKLSNERADAVLQYLMANMELPAERISAKGFGETKPVASNETEAGRAKNRRIDVFIIPAWAQE